MPIKNLDYAAPVRPRKPKAFYLSVGILVFTPLMAGLAARSVSNHLVSSWVFPAGPTAAQVDAYHRLARNAPFGSGVVLIAIFTGLGLLSCLRARKMVHALVIVTTGPVSFAVLLFACLVGAPHLF